MLGRNAFRGRSACLGLSSSAAVWAYALGKRGAHQILVWKRQSISRYTSSRSIRRTRAGPWRFDSRRKEHSLPSLHKPVPPSTCSAPSRFPRRPAEQVSVGASVAHVASDAVATCIFARLCLRLDTCHTLTFAPLGRLVEIAMNCPRGVHCNRRRPYCSYPEVWNKPKFSAQNMPSGAESASAACTRQYRAITHPPHSARPRLPLVLATVRLMRVGTTAHVWLTQFQCSEPYY
jgi:hypothetical protein